MSKVRDFKLADYKTGNYNVVTRDGQSVEIASVDEKRATLFGFLEHGQPSYWDIDGNFYPGGAEESGNDLCLTSKSITVHVNIIRSRSGKILSYCSDSKAKVKSGGTLLKYLVLDINE